MIDAKPTTAEAPATQALALPCTGQALRQALQRRDPRALDDLTRPLRVAGYRFDPLRLATDLLQNGCGWISDAFGHRVPVHVKVPARSDPPKPRDTPASFTLAL